MEKNNQKREQGARIFFKDFALSLSLIVRMCVFRLEFSKAIYVLTYLLTYR